MRSAARVVLACLLLRRGAPHFQQARGSCSAELDLASLDDADLEEIYDKAFHIFPSGTAEFSPLPDGEADLIDGASFLEGAARCRPSTYLSLPVDDVLAHPEFRAARGSPARVLDLGAGIGRPILRAALLHGASDAAGVELSETRWRAGCSAVRELDASLASAPRRPSTAARPLVRVELRLGDAMEADVSSATRVLVFATCFPSDVVVALQRKLLLELPAGARVFCAGDRGLWRGRLAEGGRAMLRADLARRSCVNASTEREDEDDILQRVWRVGDPTLGDASSHCCSSLSPPSSSSSSSSQSSSLSGL